MYAADKINVDGVPVSILPDYVNKPYSPFKEYPQVYRKYIFNKGTIVQRIDAHDTATYRVERGFVDLADHVFYELFGRSQPVPAHQLVIHTPQEPNSCNGNGKAQSTGE
jgi:hypothetical protein